VGAYAVMAVTEPRFKMISMSGSGRRGATLERSTGRSRRQDLLDVAKLEALKPKRAIAPPLKRKAGAARRGRRPRDESDRSRATPRAFRSWRGGLNGAM